MKKEYTILVIYDISNDKIRNKVFNILLGYGHNIQKSSFLCLLNNRLYKKMLFDLSQIKTPPTSHSRVQWFNTIIQKIRHLVNDYI